MRRQFATTNTNSIEIRNKHLDAFMKPMLLHGWKIWAPQFLSLRHLLTTEQVHIMFRK